MFNSNKRTYVVHADIVVLNVFAQDASLLLIWSNLFIQADLLLSPEKREREREGCFECPR